MAENTEEAMEDTESILAMSDEDALKMAPPPEEDEVAQDEEMQAAPEEEPADPESEAGQEEEAPELEASGSEETPPDSPEVFTEGEEEKQSNVETKKDDEIPTKDVAEPSNEVDYKAEYEKLTAPFKANGKLLQVSDVDDAIRLMQMGANYNKKMASLKPNLKLMRTLQDNELLDEEKLSFMIDLQKGNPAAIQKFLKDSGIDPMEFDRDEEVDYKPTTYTVDDQVIDLDSVLDDIKDTPTYGETIDIISNKLDPRSKQQIYEDPNIIKVINEHKALGVYDQVMAIVEQEKILGKIPQGMSDLEAYRYVGDIIYQNGGFDQPPADQGTASQPTPQASVNAPPAAPRPAAVKGAELNDRKRAASPTRGRPAPKQPEYDPLNMSDEEFEKQFGGALM